MKNFVIACVTFIGLSGFSFGGDCTNGFCNRPAGRILLSTKTVVTEVAKVPRRVVSGCVNGKCNITRNTKAR